MNELQQLYCELNVAKTAWTKFDLLINFICRDELHHTLTHLLSRFDEVLSPGGSPYLWRKRSDIILAEVDIARNWTGLQQGLEFPAFCPAFVIGHV